MAWKVAVVKAPFLASPSAHAALWAFAMHGRRLGKTGDAVRICNLRQAAEI